MAMLFGFSLLSLPLLGLMAESGKRVWSSTLLVLLGGMLCAHYYLLQGLLPEVWNGAVVMVFFLIAPVFYFFSRQYWGQDDVKSWRDIGHFLPVIMALILYYVLPYDVSVYLFASFVVGVLYMLSLSAKLYALKDKRRYFRVEFALLLSFSLFAIGLLLLTLLSASLSSSWQLVHFVALSLLIWLVLLIQFKYPDFLESVSELSEKNYQNTTLTHVDVEAIWLQLQQLMTVDRLYEVEDLNLSMVAERLSIKPHQLSELMNVQQSMGFSRYLREVRIAAAKQLLLDEPKVAILAVGLSVGFSSQSNFYRAFKELEGVAPGAYRKAQLKLL